MGNAVQSELYKNNGDGTFSNITESAGFEIYCEKCYIAGVLWFDFDLDGDSNVLGVGSGCDFRDFCDLGLIWLIIFVISLIWA